MFNTNFLIVVFVLQMSSIYGIKIHCNQREKIREDHIHFCCKHPDGHNDISELCAKETGFKLPSPNEEAPEDITVEQAVIGTCWAECVFTKYNLMKNKSLDMEAVRKHFKEVHALDAEYEREMVDAFDHCHDKSIDKTAQFLNSGLLQQPGAKKHCNPKPSIILSCVIHYFFHNCPKDRWAHTQECNDTLEFAKNCKDALTTM